MSSRAGAATARSLTVTDITSHSDTTLGHPVRPTGPSEILPQTIRLFPTYQTAVIVYISFVEQPRWLLLGHQLPATRSSNARVKTWRRLQQIGAVPARNSVYVLPNTE